MSFNFSRLNSLVASVHSTIRTVESSIDRAMGTDEETLALHQQPLTKSTSSSASFTAPAAAAFSSSPLSPAPSLSSSHDRVDRFVSSTTGDFFSSFGGDGFTPPIITPTRAAAASSAAATPASSSSPSSHSAGWGDSISSAASRLSHSILAPTSSSSSSEPGSSLFVTPSREKGAMPVLAMPVAGPVSVSRHEVEVEEAKEEAQQTPAEAGDGAQQEHVEENGWGDGDMDDVDVAVELDMDGDGGGQERRNTRSSVAKAAAGAGQAEERKEKQTEAAEAMQTTSTGGWTDVLSPSSPRLASTRSVSSSAASLASIFASQPPAQEQEEQEEKQPGFEQLPEEHKEERRSHISPALSASTAPRPPAVLEPAAQPEHERTAELHKQPPAVDPLLPTAVPASHPPSLSSSAAVITPPSPPAAAAPSTPVAAPAAHVEQHIAPIPMSLLSTPATPATPLTPITPYTPLTPSLAVLSSSSSTSSSAPPELQRRMENAELVATKLNRLVKIRELQLEKLQLESANTVQQLQQVTAALEVKVAEVMTVREQAEGRLDGLRRELETERRRTETLQADRDAMRRVKDASEASTEMLRAKDAQIDAVMKEGQQLMQKQANLEQIIKKLRKDMADRETQLEQERKDKQLKDAAIDRLNAELKEERERRHKAEETAADLTHSLEEANSKNSELSSQLRGMEAGSADYQLEVERLREEGRVRQAALEKLAEDVQAAERGRADAVQAVERMQNSTVSAGAREEALVRALQEAQLLLKRAEDERAMREDSLGYDVRLLRDQLREAEKRNEELVSAVPAATRPLLRQVEGLQSTMKEQAEVWSRMEASMRARVKEVELQLVRARQEKNNSEEAKHRAEMELAEKDASIRQLRDRLAAGENSSRAVRKQVEEMQDSLHDAEQRVSQLQQTVETVQREKEELEERSRKAAEERRSAETRWQQAVSTERTFRQQAEAQLEQSRQSNGQPAAAPGPSPSNSAREEASSPPHHIRHSSSYSSFPFSVSAASASSSVSPSSPYPSSPFLPLTSSSSDRSAMTATTSMLRALLHQKEGELSSLREQLHSADRLRQELSEQLIAGNERVQQLQVIERKAQAMERELTVVRVRYDAALQLIGEKEDELQELHADMTEVKNVFRGQITGLITALEDETKRRREAATPVNGTTRQLQVD